MTKTNKKAGVQPIGRTEKLYSRFASSNRSRMEGFSGVLNCSDYNI